MLFPRARWDERGSATAQCPGRCCKPASLRPSNDALIEAASILTKPRGSLLVYLGPDVTSQAQRAAVALADFLGAAVDSATSDAAAGGLLAAQRRGRATATLGEIRNRGDVLLFWGVDPNQRYPRFLSRYALEPAGTQIPKGRAGRFVIAVNIGADKGPAEADLHHYPGAVGGDRRALTHAGGGVGSSGP